MNTTRPPSWLQLRAQGLFSFTALPCPALRRRSAGSQAQTLFFHVFSSPSFFHSLFHILGLVQILEKQSIKPSTITNLTYTGFFIFIFSFYFYKNKLYKLYQNTGVTKQFSKRQNSETEIYLYFYAFILVAVIFLSLLIEDCQSRLVIGLAFRSEMVVTGYFPGASPPLSLPFLPSPRSSPFPPRSLVFACFCSPDALGFRVCWHVWPFWLAIPLNTPANLKCNAKVTKWNLGQGLVN